MVNQSQHRIDLLDALRGLGVLGILMVNALNFGLPSDVEHNPLHALLGFAPRDQAAWWVIQTFFSFKFYTLFALLFGISLFLVGQAPQGSHETAKDAHASFYKTALFRRLLFLSLVGLLHGSLIWRGDILLMYGICGLILWRWRHLDSSPLLIIGLVSYLLACLFLILPNFSYYAGDMDEQAPDLSREVLAMRDSFNSSFTQNLKAFSQSLLPTLLFYIPKTVAIMLLGLGFFKSGFFKGQLRLSSYGFFLALGLFSLWIIGDHYRLIIDTHFPYPVFYTITPIYNEVLSLLVSLGYSALMCLLLKIKAIDACFYPLKCLGRMAFTNYLMQSLIMTSLFWGGRAPEWLKQVFALGFDLKLPLYASLSHSGLIPVVMGIWILQLILSPIWLSFFNMGPLEWLWRCATKASWSVPIRRVR